ncbi:hypothetical protein GTA08_BOTSDO00859 [Neofusicoccum parvum]|nr:hypothetical protein GTA08_BOTSDO00859 [Neofusicoccum parvum]
MRPSFALLFLAVGLSAAAPLANPEPQNGGHISNGAMGANRIPCNGPNKANCGPGQPANPPSRGCSPITGCRSNGAPAKTNEDGSGESKPPGMWRRRLLTS